MQDSSDCEVIWTEVQVKGRKPIIIGTFYRTKEDTQGQRVDELSSSIASLGNKINTHHILVNGDFNLPTISWDTHVITPRAGYSTQAAVKLVKIAEDHGFNQMVNEPTRIQGSTENILDLVFSNNSSSIYKTSVVDGTADHGNVLVDVNITPTRKEKS